MDQSGTEVSTAQVSHLHLPNGHEMKVSVNPLQCVHVVCRLFIPTNTDGQCSVFVLLDGELKKLSATLSLKRVLRRSDTPNHAGYHSIGHCSLLTPLRLDQELHHSAVALLTCQC